ncbi:hypothetical protein ACSLOD_28680, partial [Escherichia coli]
MLGSDYRDEAANNLTLIVNLGDSLAVARETLRGYRDISDGVAKQVRDEVRNEVQKLDVAGLIG